MSRDGGNGLHVWRLAFAVSVLSGVAQLALLRELSASHALSTLGLAVRLVIGTVIVAYGVGAAAIPLVARIGERRCFQGLGLVMALYLGALLLGCLLWLEPGLAARAVDPARILGLAVAVSPPFVGCGLALAHLTRRIQERTPEQIGPFVAVTLMGTAVGLASSHQVAQWVGVNSLFLAAVVASLPLFTGRFGLALAAAAAAVLLPVEGELESLRRSRPDFYPPVTAEHTRKVHTGWSPYQKIDLYTFRDEVLLGTHNGFWQWWTAASTDHPHAFPGYDVLYDPAWIEDRDVLVIGAGAGMGVLHLEQSRPRSVLAVELDPLVVELARGRFAAFNDRIYDRVPVLAMEGRTFLESSSQQFDAIVYEGSFLTSSHPRVAVSAENYLYTREGVARALQRLRPGGVGLVLFAGSERALQRVARALESAGAEVAALRLSYPETLWWDLPVLVFGREAATVSAVASRIEQHRAGGRRVRRTSLAGDGVEAITDARPFLYAAGAGELRSLAAVAAVGLAALLVTLPAPAGRRLRAYYFLVGLGFMLVQYGAIASFRSFFGDPVSTSYTFVLLLLGAMALGSARLPAILAWPRPRRLALAAATTALVGGGLALLPHHWGLLPWPLRLGVAAAVTLPLGVLLGIFFPLGLRGAPASAVASAYLYDALGAATGFFLFYLIALPLGLPAALAAGALAYGGSLLALPRRS